MKKEISGELIVCLIFVGLIGFLLVFGSEITGYAVSEGSEGSRRSEKLDIEIENSYAPGEEVSFKVFLYDSELNKINGEISYDVQDFYSKSFKQGKVNSGDVVSFVLPNDARNTWGVIASHENVQRKELFKIEELEKVDIKLEDDNLILTNVGNIVYDDEIIIYIGENSQIALVHLEIGQMKKIRLTAPEGEYVVRVNSGGEDLVFDGVSLTGNVIGLERVMSGSFWSRYPLVGLFLSAVGAVVIIVFGLKMNKKFRK